MMTTTKHPDILHIFQEEKIYFGHYDPLKIQPNNEGKFPVADLPYNRNTERHHKFKKRKIVSLCMLKINYKPPDTVKLNGHQFPKG
jgi:hypothetical protein